MCTSPLQGWRSRTMNPSGKRGVTFDIKQGFADMPVTVPCGQCIACRLDRSRQWAIRCMHEAQLWPSNCFVTLTYDNDHLPSDGSLHLDHFQKFMKRLRKHYGNGIRFYHCGEYGSRHGRPHYHVILFNHDFSDKYLYRLVNGGHRLYRSPTLERLWPFGYSTIGAVTFESAAYVARYVLKKVTGDAADDHYEMFDPETGEVWSRKPEYVTMSRRPGIASGWYDRFSSDVYPNDSVVIRGKEMKPPKYYDRLFELDEPMMFRKLKLSRQKAAELREADTSDRALVKQRINEMKLLKLLRPYENEDESIQHL